MRKTKIKVVILLFIFLNISTFLFIDHSDYISHSIEEADFIDVNIKSSRIYQEEVIIFFNKPSYNNTVISRFEYYGGTVKKEWNGTFTSFSGFSAVMPSMVNISIFQTEFPDARIENDEILEAQMNYASIQSGASNSTWYKNGFKGNTNSSIAVLDTGVDPNHIFFPNGYESVNLSGNIVAWENFINENTIFDDNGHGTFISSIISGTGKVQYNSSTPTILKFNRSYSHMNLFNEYSVSKNYTFKICSFNASKTDSNIVINSSWNIEVDGIDAFWVELYYNDELMNFSHNNLTNEYYTINYSLTSDTLGVYDIYLKYHKQIQSKPVFSFNTTISYFPEFFTKNYSHFTGIANATKIVAYKILNQSGIGHTSALISALSSILLNRSKYHVLGICLSVGTLGDDVVAINRVIDEVIKKGILVVIASGNKGIEQSDSLNRLAQNKNAIVVGAINDKDQVTSYSSMGGVFENITRPDIVAPGGSKISGHRSIISADVGGDKVTASYGTSIATAIVSSAVNIIIEAKWNNWDNWNQLNLTKWVKYIKGTLLMTASETNLEREDDPFTVVDESDNSPTLSPAPLITGLKDVHEGYGRINIQAAIEALTKYMSVNSTLNGTLVSSQENPLGTHVIARQINFTKDVQYAFELSLTDTNSDFDVLLFSNKTNRYGEPILLESTRKLTGDLNYFYFTPKENQTNCVVTIKAIDGQSFFTLNISEVKNDFVPELKVPEIFAIGGARNTTVLSQQEFLGMEPKKNYTIDSFRFYIEYYDNDTRNVPPQEIYISILETSKNYTMTQFFLFDDNYTDGTLFISDYIQFSTSGIYHYSFIGSDGKFKVKYPETGYLNISIEFPTESIQYPNYHSFNDGFGNWTFTGTGWNILQQDNSNDNRSRLYENKWNSVYFGVSHEYPQNYTYQPFRLTIDPYPNGSLISPLFNLTQLNDDPTSPFAKFGLRMSLNAGDFIYLQINLNWTGWNTLRTYTDNEEDWFLEEINLTQYIGNFIQFRFETSLDDTFDHINYKGFMLDYFAIENYTNKYSPRILFNMDNYISSLQGSKFQQFTFSCEYYDLDSNYPEFIYLEIDDTNYTMYNTFGDWNASSTNYRDRGIFFIKSIQLDEITNQSFRFHVSDGKYLNKTQWFNRENTLFEFIDPISLQFKEFKDNKFIGYNFSNSDLSDYYVSGTPIPKEMTTWLNGDNTWHPIIRLGQNFLYGGLGQSYGGSEQGYGPNWDIKLITHPLHVRSEYSVYLEYDYDISLQNEFFLTENLDACNVSISKDFGKTWVPLKEYTYDLDDLTGKDRIDISQYVDEDIMIMFRLNSNENIFGLGYGWLLSNIYIGYDKMTDFIAPEIDIISPEPDITAKSTLLIEAILSDNVELDESRIYIFLNNNSVDRDNLKFDSNTSILEFNWDTTQNHDGRYEVRLVAYDMEGNKGETSILIIVNNLKWWQEWWPYLMIISLAVVIGIVLFFVSEKGGKIWVHKVRNMRAERIRLKYIDKDQTIKNIELIEQHDEIKRPLTLFCKSCKSWFASSKFDIICPVCEHDQIFAAYNCENCGRWWWKDEPGEGYYCKNKTCQGIRLVRREKEDIQNLLAKDGIFLRKFKIKRRRYSILDG